jgi:hypothetical protein
LADDRADTTSARAARSKGRGSTMAMASRSMRGLMALQVGARV